MAWKPRVELQEYLENLIQNKNVYFQPPESFKINYPCIIYELSNIGSRKADNVKYKIVKEYTVTIIDKNPDSKLFDKMFESDYCRFDRHFVNDNLHHWVFSVFW